MIVERLDQGQWGSKRTRRRSLSSEEKSGSSKKERTSAKIQGDPSTSKNPEVKRPRSAAKTETFAETKQHEFEPTPSGSSSLVENTIIEEARSSSDGEKDPTSREKDLLNSLEEAGHIEAGKLNINSENETLGQDEDMKGLFEPGAKQQLRIVEEKNLEVRKEVFKDKLTIRLVKDNAGNVIRGKIKNKPRPSSMEEIEDVSNAPLKVSTVSHPGNDISLPEDPDEPFHGFPASAVDLRHELRDYEGWDLTTPFRIRPTLFVSIKSKNTVVGGMSSGSSGLADSVSSPVMKTEPPQVALNQVGNIEVITLGDSEDEDENELNVSQVVSKTRNDYDEALSHAPPHDLDLSSRSKQSNEDGEEQEMDKIAQEDDNDSVVELTTIIEDEQGIAQKKKVRWSDDEPGGTLMLSKKEEEDDSFTEVRSPSNVVKRFPL